MKSNFSKYYLYSEEARKNAHDNGIYILDTNILLHFVRLGPSYRETMLLVLDKIKDRVLIPYHAAEEYHPHYIEECVNQIKLFESAKNSLMAYMETHSILNQLDKNQKRVLSKKFKDDIDQKQQQIVDDVINNYDQEIQFLRNELRTMELHNQIATLFEGKLLAPLTQQEMDNIINVDGPARYSQKTPPGYKDAGKPDNQYGDLIIWSEILKFASNNIDKPIIFVSDDVKEDWLFEIKGENHGPRWELIEEFIKVSDSLFYIQTSDRLISDVIKDIPNTDLETTKEAELASTLYRQHEELMKSRLRLSNLYKKFSQNPYFNDETDTMSLPSNKMKAIPIEDKDLEKVEVNNFDEK